MAEAAQIALAERLRACTAALALNELHPTQVEAAAKLATELERQLQGPERTRWWQTADTQAAFLDQSPLRGLVNAVAPPLELAVDPDAGVVTATVTMSRVYEGPPGGVHGGFVAALYDEVLGATQGLASPGGMTGKLTIKYRKPTPIGVELTFRGVVTQSVGRRIITHATCHVVGDGPEPLLVSEAEGLFVRVDFAPMAAAASNEVTK